MKQYTKERWKLFCLINEWRKLIINHKKNKLRQERGNVFFKLQKDININIEKCKNLRVFIKVNIYSMHYKKIKQIINSLCKITSAKEVQK